MGMLDFFKSRNRQSSELNSIFSKLHAAAFPGGETQLEQESNQLHDLLDRKISRSDAKQLLLRTKCLLLIANDTSENRVVRSILGSTKGRLKPADAKCVYQFLVGISDELYSGGNGVSEEDAVVINTTSSIIGIDAEYKWIENRYGFARTDWTIHKRFHKASNDGHYYETFEIILSDGRKIPITFEISSFFGK